MRFPEFHYRWEWQLQATPDALWPMLADTNRFNRDTGVPDVERGAAGLEPSPNARRRLRFRRFGVPVEWEEEPFEWVRPARFGVLRRYLTGPLATSRVLAELTPSTSGGCQLIYQVWAQPRSWLGLVAIPIQVGILSARRFDRAIRQYDRTAAGRHARVAPVGRVRLAPGGRDRLASCRAALLQQSDQPDLVGRLVQAIERADDLDLARIRPYALADAWSVRRHSVLELCLLATRVGLLELQWKVLCPLCRGSRDASTTLFDVRSRSHCESCHIDFTADFERSVELTFRPSRAVRELDLHEFCVGGPAVTPHIVAQQLLPAGAERTLTLPLEAGRYRLRTVALSGARFLAAGADGSETATLVAEADGWPGDELGLSTRPMLHFRNATAAEQLFVLERLSWTDQAATAAEVIALQTFRDLFASEVLRPGEECSVGSLAIVFTDLRGSTTLYREIGDAVAFGRVLNHFDVLKAAIAREDGAVVKTIGDAMMAVFRRPVSALRAMTIAQATLAASAADSPPLALKVGVHYGPSIAVTLNDRLDYFGSTINLAARLEGQSSGRDIIVSSSVRHDPEVAEWLTASRMRVEPLESTLKGFDQERFDLWRVLS